MEISSALTEHWEKVRDWTVEQEWFQQLKSKWDELDPQSQFYVKVGAVAVSGLCVLSLVFSALWSVKSIENELRDKQDLLTQLQSTTEEKKRLTEQGVRPPAADEKPNWPGYIDGLAATAGLDKTNYDMGAQKDGTATDISKEALMDVKLKHVSIIQVVKLAVSIETGAKPMKLRQLDIDTKADPDGYMDATLSVSGFTLLAVK